MQSSSPNVLVFFTDQQRWDSTGVHGNPLDITPNFDRMALSGTHVYHSFTSQPVCGPARSCFQTGMYATQTGCYRNDIPLHPDARTLAHHFRDAGYQTAYIGKWHLADEEPVPETKRGGYQYWLASNILEFTSDAYNTVVYNNDCQPVKLPGYRVDALTDAAIRYIDVHQQTPFFMFLSFIEPHHQNHRDDYPAPDGYAERCLSSGRIWIPPDLAALGGSTHQHIAGYYGMIKRLDEALGRIIEALKSLDLLENTIILLSSDHGCHFKTRNSEYKRSPHESSIRVPTAFMGPGFNGGGRLNQLVSLVDLPATLLDAAGIPVPEAMQGRSVLPLIRKEQTDWPDEVFVQISESQVGRAVRTHRWKYSVVAPDKDGWTAPGAEFYRDACLYDLYADPYELNNLIGLESHREVVEVMRERLRRRMRSVGEEDPRFESAPSRPAGQRHVTTEEARS
jgi:arylsulfatase A-like enzyme